MDAPLPAGFPLEMFDRIRDINFVAIDPRFLERALHTAGSFLAIYIDPGFFFNRPQHSLHDRRRGQLSTHGPGYFS